MSTQRFVPLPDNFELTRATLHSYANAVGVIPRAHGRPHAKWWHISLNVTPLGLETDTMALPNGGVFNVRMDLRTHEIVVETYQGTAARISMTAGKTGTEMGDALIGVVAELGLGGDYARDKFENDEPREYDAAVAATYFDVLSNVHEVLATHRASLQGDVGPLQVWPHGFDLAFEWFGTRMEKYEENGEMEMVPSQLNLGFYPAARAYLYSNPWPFEADKLVGVDLPGQAEWNTEGWEGSILYYEAIAGAEDAGEQIAQYARKVFDTASPTLTA